MIGTFFGSILNFLYTSHQSFAIMRTIGRYPYEKTNNCGASADCSHFYCDCSGAGKSDFKKVFLL